MAGPHPGGGMPRCPGCGGRNDPSARACVWCGRPFVAQRQQITAPWLAPATVAFIAILGLATIIVALVGARASQSRNAEPAPASILRLPEVEPSPTSEGDLGLRGDGQSPFALDEFVRVANTGGAGAFLRQEPRSNAPGVLAYREGTILRVSGPDATGSDGRVWRQVEDRQGNRGWTPRDFLVASDAAF